MFVEGRETFRFDTFGDEVFWGDTLRLHEAIVGDPLRELHEMKIAQIDALLGNGGMVLPHQRFILGTNRANEHRGAIP